MATGVTTLSEYDEDTGRPKKDTPRQWHKYWSKEKEAAERRQKTFRSQGNKVVSRFLDERKNLQGSSNPIRKLNLFYVNVTTLMSMLYGSTPKIEVSREHQDPDDDMARVASVLYQRILDADVASSGNDLPTILRAVLQDRLLPGLGVARVRYEVETEEFLDAEGQEMSEMTAEWCDIDYVHWQDFLWGWGRTWSEIPWVGFRAYLDKDQVKARFGEDVAKDLSYEYKQVDADEDSSGDGDTRENIAKTEVWEFWHKEQRKVFWYSCDTEKVLESKDDPLGLDGFFPCPMPLVANCTTSLYMPTADFVMAQDLYNEIDELTTRIYHLTRAIKVVGVYDSSAEGVKRMLTEGSENQLIPVENWAMFAEKGGLKGVVDWFPVEDVVNTLQVLKGTLDSTIELLYQITGMSDILRGANTDQYTSDGTQQLKAKFGSVRVQSLQDEFARFASDLSALKTEVVSKHFEAESIAQQSNAQFMPLADQQLVPPALQLMKEPGIKWRVNIRPESIAMVDYAQLKSERTEFLTAISTYLQSAQAVVQAVPGSLPILLEMLKWGMAGFKGANYLEGTMDQAIEMSKKAPPPEQDDGGAKEAQVQDMVDQKAHERKLQELQAKTQSSQLLEDQKSRNQMQIEMADHQNKLQLEREQHMAEMRQMQKEFQQDMAKMMQDLKNDLMVERAQSTYAIEERNIEHDHTMSEIKAKPTGGSDNG